jgi:hypothetical protein
MNPFRSLPEYERFVCTLQQRYPSVLHATLTVARRSRGLAIVAGELHFDTRIPAGRGRDHHLGPRAARNPALWL